MVMLLNQKLRVNQKRLRVHWSDSFWVVRIVLRRAGPTFRRLSIPATFNGFDTNGYKANSLMNTPSSTRSARPLRRSGRARGEIRRRLVCPSAASAPLMAFASLPLRCRNTPRLRLQNFFRHPGL
jgi:hypothetical protein